MDAFEAYVTADKEMLSFDEALSGVRTLLQNQSETGFLVNTKALTMAHMLIADQDTGVEDRCMTLANEVPWVSIRRRILDGGGVPKKKNKAIDTSSIIVACKDTLDSGTTGEYIDRLLAAKKSQGPDDSRSRQIAAAMSPITLPEKKETGSHLNTKSRVRNNNDVDAVCSIECASELYIPSVRLLAKEGDIPGDDANQMGIAFLGDPTQAFVQFDVGMYVKHLMSLKSGDKVMVMLDTLCSVQGSTSATGKVTSESPNTHTLVVHLDDEVTIMNKDGIIRVDFDRLHAASAFVYGSTWKGEKYCRSKLFHPHNPTTLIPLNAIDFKLIPLIEPDVVHKVLGLLDASTSASIAELIGTDDTPLDILQTRRMDIILEHQVRRATKLQSVETQHETDTQPHAFASSFRQQSTISFFTNIAKDTQRTLIPKTVKEAKHTGRKKTIKPQQGGRYEKDDNDILPPLETCVWAPSSILEGLEDDCDTNKANMLQGHVLGLARYGVSQNETADCVFEALRHRSKSLQEDIALLSTDMGKLERYSEKSAVRLSIEVQRASLDLLTKGKCALYRDPRVSPFDTYRDYDLERWTTYLARRPSHESDVYKGDQQEAFEADLMDLRMAFDDLPHYHEFRTEKEPDRSGVKLADDVENQFNIQGVASATVLLETLIESCEVMGVKAEELDSILRNVKQYRPEEHAQIRVRQRIELVKKARNRPEFKEKRQQSRLALEKRLIDRVQQTAIILNTIGTMSMITALLVLLIENSNGRISLTIANHSVKKKTNNKSLSFEQRDKVLNVLAHGAYRLLLAILPPNTQELENKDELVKAIHRDVKEVEDDKTVNGVELVTTVDLEYAFVHSRAVRDAPWGHFRPIMADISSLGNNKLSKALHLVAALQRTFSGAVPMHRSQDGARITRHNVCCPYLVESVDKLVDAHKYSTMLDLDSKTYARPLATILKGSTAAVACEPTTFVKYVGPAQSILHLQGYDSSDTHESRDTKSTATWMEDVFRRFLELNPLLEADTALARIASQHMTKSPDVGRAAWSSLSSQNIARFEELCSKVAIPKDQVSIVRETLLSPTVSLDGVNLQEQQYHARNFLRSVVIPMFGRIANMKYAQAGSDVDEETTRLIQIMRIHDPTSDVSTIRSSFASYGSIHGANALMLASGPVKSIPSLRASVQLHMGVAFSALWHLLKTSGGGPLGLSIVRPTIQLCMSRLVSSLRFSRADESVTRLIQEQREDDKLRKIAIYERIAPEDVELVKEFRLIKKKKDLDWDVIERDYARVDVTTVTDGQDDATQRIRQEEEVGALGAYPDDERDVALNDGDQEMMEYAD